MTTCAKTGCRNPARWFPVLLLRGAAVAMPSRRRTEVDFEPMD